MLSSSSPFDSMGDSSQTDTKKSGLKKAIADLAQSGTPVDQIVQWATQYAQNPYALDNSGMASSGGGGMQENMGGLGIGNMLGGGSPADQAAIAAKMKANPGVDYMNNNVNDGGLAASNTPADPNSPLMQMLLKRSL